MRRPSAVRPASARHPGMAVLALGAVALGGIVLPAPAAAQKRALTWTDLMAFRTAEGVALSDDGRTLALSARPDRGDAEGLVYRTTGGAPARVPRGAAPAVSADGRHAVFRVDPALAATERARLRRRSAPPAGAALVDTRTGRTVAAWDDVRAFALSKDGRYLALHFGKAGPTADTLRADSAVSVLPDSLHAPPDTTLRPAPDSLQRLPPARLGEPGRRLLVRDLRTGREAAFAFVRSFAFSEDGRYLALAVAAADTTRDGLFVRDLGAGRTLALDARPRGAYRHLTWSRTGTLAYLVARENAKGEAGDAALWTWRPGERPALRADSTSAPPGWRVPPDNRLTWTDDGARLFFGYGPRPPAQAPRDTTVAPLSVDALLRDRTMDVWGGRDGRIQPQQKRRWDEVKRRVWLAVLPETGPPVRLDSADVLLAEIPQNDRTGLARATERYAAELSWDAEYADVYAVDLRTGRRTRLAVHAGGPTRLAPDGRAVVLFDDGAWVVLDAATGARRPLTAGLPPAFADEDHDLPGPAPAYGLAGFVGGDRPAALVYDRYDVWALPLGDAPPVNLTDGAGRAARRRLRVVSTDPQRRWYAPTDTLLLSGYDERARTTGLWRVALTAPAAPERLLDGPFRAAFVAKAKRAATVVFSRETFEEVSDLWAADGAFRRVRKLTDLNPQRSLFRWGKAEPVAWRSLDGDSLDGVLLRPDGADADRRCPTVVSLYERQADRLYVFPGTQVSHRPAWPLYLGDGYCVFLPDVRYRVGQPGASAVKAVLPGVQMLVDRGIADPARIGLHGHSWGGYEVAYLVTQTDLFRAAVAGAPVSNMTSAYGGVRWETGVSRQFQYERTQSRIGASLWAARDRYVENSPLFYADRVRTPLLLLHGDEDGAVPWEQSIEFYLALRRLGRDVTFLQYRGEGHHPAAYANKLDWAMRMKAFFDTHLLGRTAPAWLSEGTPYAGD